MALESGRQAGYTAPRAPLSHRQSMSTRKTSILLALFALAAACNDEAGRSDSEGDAGQDAVHLDVSVDGIDDASGSDAITIDDVALVACDKEDDLSPNHSAADATTVEGGTLEAEALYVCADTDDWFRVEARAGQTLTASIQFADRIGDLDLYLLPEGTDDLEAAVAASGTREDVEELTYVVPADGVYFVVVDGFDGSVGVYGLSIGLSCSGSDDCPDGFACSFVEQRCVEVDEPLCGDDEYEPNDNAEAATPVEVGADGFAFLHGLTVCDVDDDYFVLELDEPTSIGAELDFDRGVDLDLYVFSTTGELLDAAATDSGIPEVLERPYSAAGTYVFVIDYHVTDIGNDVTYNLTLELVAASCESNLDCSAPGRQVCEDGACVAFDPETPSGPGELCDGDDDCAGDLQCYEGNAGIDDNFCTVGCGGDGDCSMLDDGYCLDLGRSGVCFDSCQADTDCPTFYSCGDAGRCGLDGCRLDADCGEGRLCRRSEQQNSGFCTSVEFAGCDDDDDLEPNDTESSASPVDAGATDELRICDGDDDWFTIDVAEAGKTLEVSVRFDGSADLDVFVFDAEGRTVAAGTEPDANPERARADYLDAGTYLVRVNQFPGEVDYATDYSIAIELTSDTCTVEGEECLDLAPLRIECDEDGGGVCRFFEGAGEVELGGICDSSDDCVDDAEFCWAFEGAAAGRNICTIPCREDGDCDDVPDTECQVFGRGFGACLPPD